MTPTASHAPRPPSRAAIGLLAGLAAAFAAAAQSNDTVEVFTDATRWPVADAPGAKVYDLSEAKRLADALGRGLPRSPQAAQAMAAERFAAQKQNLAAVYAGHAQAIRYGITKIPAAVFNQGEAVVYGVADVAEASGIYRRWKEGR